MWRLHWYSSRSHPRSTRQSVLYFQFLLYKIYIQYDWSLVNYFKSFIRQDIHYCRPVVLFVTDNWWQLNLTTNIAPVYFISNLLDEYIACFYPQFPWPSESFPVLDLPKIVKVDISWSIWYNQSSWEIKGKFTWRPEPTCSKANIRQRKRHLL